MSEGVIDIRYMQAMASIEMCKDGGIVDLTMEDFNFLTGDKLWVVTDRSRARRCIESCAYGALDMVGLPRFALPVEFIAGCIAHYVKPCNIMVACEFMEGCNYSENIINGVEMPVKASELFAHVLRIKSNETNLLENLFEHCKRYIPAVPTEV